MSSFNQEKIPSDNYRDYTVNDEGNSTCLHNVNHEFKIMIGMVFKSGDEAYDTYNAYALSKGFGVRKDKTSYDKNGKITRCVYVCSYSGHSEMLNPYEPRQRERLEYRCGCNAGIKLKIQNELWEVYWFNDQHNHEMVPENQRHFIRSARKITKSSASILDSMANAGIRATKSYTFLTKEAGGVKNIGFTMSDCNNFLQSRRRNMISGGDAQALLSHFARKQMEDPMFFYSAQLDDESRLTNFFWRDGMSKLHYECFGDVVVFDTTYRTNKYNMICAPFVGLNHHWKNVFFGCAFLLDETIASFTWLFETFLSSMKNKAPKTIFTDQDQAMANAIEKVFFNTCHRLCTWHISKNAAQNIPNLYGKPEFKDKYFGKLLNDCENAVEFDTTWKKMMEKFDVANNTWLQRLYQIREKWCPAFSKDFFSADMSSTQRSESTNNVFNQMACKTMTLTEFVKHYDDESIKMREIENTMDFKSRGKPKILIEKCGILKDAATLYTHTIFFRFQHEFLQAFDEIPENTTIDGTRHLYKFLNGQRSRVVEYYALDCTIKCSCKMFESLGWFCRHILRVLHLDLKMKSIPSEYVLNRWTKDAKKGIGFEKYNVNSESILSSSTTVLLNKLMRKSFLVMSLSSSDIGSAKIAERNLDQTIVEVNSYQASLGLKDHDVSNIDESENLYSTNEIQVRDPRKGKAKGIGYNRLKGSLEKRKKKTSKQATSSQAPQSTNSSTDVVPLQLPSYQMPNRLEQPLFNSSGLDMFTRNGNHFYPFHYQNSSGYGMFTSIGNPFYSSQMQTYVNQNMSFTQLLNQELSTSTTSLNLDDQGQRRNEPANI